jgi:hypothetical protein
VDAILERSSTPPIIVIQSDHGPGLGTDVAKVEKTDLFERMSNLIAVYAPRASEHLYPTITPVNVFRVLFNTYLGGRFQHLPDRSFYAPWNRPGDLVDVTRRARTPPPR